MLGMTPCELVYAHVRAAVEQGVAEAEALDWKQALPPSDDRKRKEFAKDVAAMANARGRLIVFGVAEGTSALPVLSVWRTVKASAKDCGRLRRSAFARW